MIHVRFRGETKAEGKKNHFYHGFQTKRQALRRICTWDRVGTEFQILRTAGGIIGTYVVASDQTAEPIPRFDK